MTHYLIDGQLIAANESGPASAPVAILIHGWSSSSFTWKPLLPALSRRYRCIAIDLPGFGESPAPAATPTIAFYTDLVAHFIEQVSDRAVLVLGHSMGGQIATTLALRYPMLVERLVLLNPAISGRLSTRVNLLLAPHVFAERYRFLELVIALLAKTPLDYTDFLLKPSSFAERAHVTDEDYAQIRQDARRRGQGRIRAACFTAMRRGDLRGQMRAVEPPALVIWGAEDNIVPLRDAGCVAAEWPEIDLRIIPNAGHWPQFEQPASTLHHITQFLGLPLASGGRSGDEPDLAQVQEIASFLTTSEVGRRLSSAQRLRLASLLHHHAFEPGEIIAATNTIGDEMYVVMNGTVEVSVRATPRSPAVSLALIQAGQIAGELSLLDNTVRSADLRAGHEGTIVLALSKDHLATLAAEDAELGMLLMQSIAISLGRRLRLQNHRASRYEAELDAREMGA